MVNLLSLGFSFLSFLQVPVDLGTDRPDFTESVLTVPPGRLQVELGATYAPGSVSGPEALLRMGATPSLELRLELPDYGLPGGFGDGAFGVKTRLPTLMRGVEAVLIASAILGQDESGTSLNLSWNAPGAFGSFAFSSQGDQSWAATLGTKLPLLGDWGPFIEHYATFGPALRTQHLIHLGAARAIGRQSQIDLHLGFGLVRGPGDFLVGAGYAVRL